jgi:L,D-peptidoglycan transpeptidase YkuD (ErfK/YbiS/YcfS/YnhG family)
MIIVKKTGHLKYKNYLFRCSLGKSGIKKKIKEGDNITPKGIFKIVSIYYRPDKITKIKTSIKTFKIKKNMGWCDDPFSENYNKEITINKNFLFSFERLFRKDNIYDLIAVLNYNSNPVIKNKGSAIFIHIAKKNYTPTKGCLALKKKDLINILSNIRKNTLIKITNN